MKITPDMLKHLSTAYVRDLTPGSVFKVLGIVESPRSEEPLLRDLLPGGARKVSHSFQSSLTIKTAFVVTDREPADGAVQYVSKGIEEQILDAMRQQEDELFFGKPVAPVEPTQNTLQALLAAAKALDSIWSPDTIRAYVMHPIFWKKLMERQGQPAPSSPPTGHLGGVRQVIQGMHIHTDLAMPHTKAYGVKHKCFEAFQRYLREGMQPLAALMMASIECMPQKPAGKPQGKKKRSRQANPPRQSTFQVGKKPRKEWE